MSQTWHSSSLRLWVEWGAGVPARACRGWAESRVGLQKTRLDDTESGHGMVRTTGGTWKWGQGEEGTRALLPLS